MKNGSIWSEFEHLPGLVRAVADWKSSLGAEFARINDYLKPVHGLASSLPCPAQPQCGCDHAVIEHKRDDLVSVCRCEPKTCDTRAIERADAVVCELNLAALGGGIAEAFGVRADVQHIDGLRATRLVGTFSPQVGVNIPLILTMQTSPDDLQVVVERLMARDDRPFVLLSPTDRHLTPASDRLLRSKKAAFVPLSETVIWNGTLSANQSLSEIVPDTIAAVLPPIKDKYLLKNKGSNWEVAFQDVTKTLNQSKGMTYIAHLLRNPRQDIFCFALRSAAVGDDGTVILGSAGPTLDQKAINDYKEKIENIKEELQIASGDRKAKLLEEQETLLKELGLATGLGGRKRNQSDDLERARQSVSRAIHGALKGIKQIHPPFHQHLENTIHVGTVLSYRPSEQLVWAAE
jgi:hypothetical protein